MIEQKTFYKYMSADTAKIVLENNSFRWSSPLLFNDPFDVPRQLLFDVDRKNLFESIKSTLLSLINNLPKDTTSYASDIKVLLDKIKKENYDKEQIQLIMIELNKMNESDLPQHNSLISLQNTWKSMLPAMRILCFTESQDHVSMWYHYAQKYSGVVLEVTCNVSLDSVWLLAKPVLYPLAKPDVYTAKGWAEILLKKKNEAVKKILEDAIFTKSPDWSYEKEWRIHSTKRSHESGYYSDWKFDKRELTSLYLGPLISNNDKDEIFKLVKPYRDIKIYEVSIGMSRELNYNSLN